MKYEMEERLMSNYCWNASGIDGKSIAEI